MQPRNLRPRLKVTPLNRTDLPRLMLRQRRLNEWHNAVLSKRTELLKKIQMLSDQTTRLVDNADTRLTEKEWGQFDQNTQAMRRLQAEWEKLAKKTPKLDKVNDQIRDLQKMLREIHLQSMLAQKK